MSALQVPDIWRYEFFQVVRLLELMAREEASKPPAGDSPRPARQAVGYSVGQAEEVVRFRALPSRSFPSGAIARLDLEPGVREGRTGGEDLPEMEVAFMGLTGPAGVLPEHYLDMLLARIRAGDHALQDFLDLFNHRSISLYYRAWEKYRFPIAYERAASSDGGPIDTFSRALRSVVGLGTDHLAHRAGVDPSVPVYYGAHFACQVRSAAGLEAILADYFSLPVQVEEFRGQWLMLDEDDLTQLPVPDWAPGQNHQLDISAVAGNRMFDVQGVFRLRLGPLSAAQFDRLLPGGEGFAELVALTRLYAGTALTFTVQLVHERKAIRGCRAGTRRSRAARLGWNSWLRTNTRSTRSGRTHAPEFDPARYSKKSSPKSSFKSSPKSPTSGRSTSQTQQGAR